MQAIEVVTIASGGAIALSTVLGGAIYVGRPLRKLLKQNEEFREDWYGTAARAGRDRQPGVMERLQSIEQRQGRIEGQLVTNGGSSMRDAVNRIETEQRRLRSQFEDQLRTLPPAAATQVVVHPAGEHQQP